MTKRNTIQRQLVIAAVRFLADHPTAEEVYDRITMEYPDISKGTVYRNLNLLAENGEVLKIPAFGGADHFDMTAPMHYHGICRNCGEVYDLEIDSSYVANLKKKIKNDNGFKVEGHEILFKGLCAGCQKIK